MSRACSSNSAPRPGSFASSTDPVKLIKRHPFVAAGLAAAAAFMLARYVQRKPAGSSGGKTASPGLFDSLLSGVAGAAGSALPELVASWLAQGSKSN